MAGQFTDDIKAVLFLREGGGGGAESHIKMMGMLIVKMSKKKCQMYIYSGHALSYTKLQSWTE